MAKKFFDMISSPLYIMFFSAVGNMNATPYNPHTVVSMLKTPLDSSDTNSWRRVQNTTAKATKPMTRDVRRSINPISAI